jgi:hypothetical protein
VGRFFFDDETGQIVVLNPFVRGDSLCLTATSAYAEMMKRNGGGSPLSLEACDNSKEISSFQSWIWDPRSHSYLLKSFEEQCLTVGWPFLQGDFILLL